MRLFFLGVRVWLALVAASYSLESLEFGVLYNTVSYVCLSEHENLFLGHSRFRLAVILLGIHNDEIAEAIPHLQFGLNATDYRQLHKLLKKATLAFVVGDLIFR